MWSYNNLAGRNGIGLCGDATMPRDSLVVLIYALKIPAWGAEYTLTENAISPFLAESTQMYHRRVP